MHYVCAKCGGVHPPEHVTQWGKHQASSGYGPRAICTNLVPNGIRTLDARVGIIEGNEVCGGDLAPVAITSAAVLERIQPVRPIEAFTPPIGSQI